MPSGQEVLIATVDGQLGVITVPAPSGGFPVGNGFQVNFVNDTSHLSTILAQSTQFAITQSNTTTSSKAVPTVYVFFFRPLAPIMGHFISPTLLTLLYSTGATAASNPSQTTDSAGDLNPTDSASNSTSGSNGAAHITAAGSTGLIFAALAAFFL
jgi:hypothetical protein